MGTEADLIKIVARQDGHYVIDRIFKGGKGVVSAHAIDDVPTLVRLIDISSVSIRGNPISLERPMPDEYRMPERPIPLACTKTYGLESINRLNLIHCPLPWTLRLGPLRVGSGLFTLKINTS